MIKIVVIEDENLVRKGLVLTTPWEEFGCQVIGEASNGLDGLDLIRRFEPDIAITDIRMPDINGLQMIERLQGTVATDFLIISGYNEFEYAKKALKLGVKDYLLKPIDDQEFHQVLCRMAAEIRARRQSQKMQSHYDQIHDSKIMLFKEHLLPDDCDTKEYYVREALQYIQDHFPEEIGIKEAAAQLHISESYLSRLFKNETHHTFNDYLTHYRIKKAVELLKDKTVKVYEISGLVGYADARYFSALFKKTVGVTPSEFKDGLNRKNDKEP